MVKQLSGERDSVNPVCLMHKSYHMLATICKVRKTQAQQDLDSYDTRSICYAALTAATNLVSDSLASPNKMVVLEL